MNGKIVYFIETQNALGYSNANLLDILNEVSFDKDYDVYYVNHRFEGDLTRNPETQISFVNIDECDFTEFEDSIFITPAHHLINLLTRIKELNKAKIALMFNEPVQFHWLASHIPEQIRDKEQLAEFLSSSGCMFFDKRSLLGARKAGVEVKEPVVLPFVCDNEYNEELINKENIKICSVSQGEPPRRLSIGWLGPVTPRALTSIQNLAENLYFLCLKGAYSKTIEKNIKEFIKQDSFFKGEEIEQEMNSFEALLYSCKASSFAEKIQKIIRTVDDDESLQNEITPIDFHIIGHGAALWKLNFKKYSPMIRFLFVGDLEPKAAEEYIHENVDILAAYDQNALVGAYSGVPTIVPISDQKTFAGDHYVYLSDVDCGTLSWSKAQLNELEYPARKIADVIRDVYILKKKTELSELCFNAARDHHSKDAMAKKLKDFIGSSPLLSLKECLEFPGFAGQISAYEEYLSENPGSDYSAFLNSQLGK